MIVRGKDTISSQCALNALFNQDMPKVRTVLTGAYRFVDLGKSEIRPYRSLDLGVRSLQIEVKSLLKKLRCLKVLNIFILVEWSVVVSIRCDRILTKTVADQIKSSSSGLFLSRRRKYSTGRQLVRDCVRFRHCACATFFSRHFPGQLRTKLRQDAWKVLISR